MQPAAYRLLADAILLLHFAFVAFVVLGLIVIWIGYFCGWRFVRNFYFRVAHLVAMGFVLAEALLGFTCPLTTWEAKLRSLTGEDPYQGSFIQHWVSRLLFFNFPEWSFMIVYVAFFGLILLSYWVVQPERRRRQIYR
jgi:hypothetical protein